MKIYYLALRVEDDEQPQYYTGMIWPHTKEHRLTSDINLAAYWRTTEGLALIRTILGYNNYQILTREI